MCNESGSRRQSDVKLGNCASRGIGDDQRNVRKVRGLQAAQLGMLFVFRQDVKGPGPHGPGGRNLTFLPDNLVSKVRRTLSVVGDLAKVICSFQIRPVLIAR
jgi:hypothetical protein